MGLAQDERAALSDLLIEVGPDRPTLCTGWNTGDLLVHLLVRERRPDAAAGILLPRLAGYAERVGRQFRDMPWPDQVALLRAGPPAWNPMGWGPVDEAANGAELLIHHEDARRGVAGWTERPANAARDRAAAALVGSAMVRMRLRRCPVGITAVMPGHDPRVLRAGTPVAEIHGAPVEVLLWLGGRTATHARIDGDADAVRAAQALHLRM